MLNYYLETQEFLAQFQVQAELYFLLKTTDGLELFMVGNLNLFSFGNTYIFYSIHIKNHLCLKSNI